MNFLRKLLIRDGRIRFPSRIWIVGIITFLVFALMAPTHTLTATGLITFIGVVIPTTQVEKHPLLSSVAFHTVFAIASQAQDLFNGAVIFWVIFFLGALANSGNTKLAWGCAATLLYLSSVELTKTFYLPNDMGSVFANAIFFIGAILIGMALHKERLKQAALVEQMQQRRDVLTRALHDSVAAKLSSVILRSETLSLSGEVEPSTRATLSLIAEEARLAIGDVRQLLEAMKTNTEFAPPTTRGTLAEQIAEIISLMESHKLRVVWNNQLTSELNRITTPVGFSNVLSELAMNAIKYSPPESIVQIVSSLEGNFIVTEIANVIADQQTSHYLTTGLGIAGISEWANKVGATYTQEQTEDIWTIKVGFPK